MEMASSKNAKLGTIELVRKVDLYCASYRASVNGTAEWFPQRTERIDGQVTSAQLHCRQSTTGERVHQFRTHSEPVSQPVKLNWWP